MQRARLGAGEVAKLRCGCDTFGGYCTVGPDAHSARRHLRHGHEHSLASNIRIVKTFGTRFSFLREGDLLRRGRGVTETRLPKVLDDEPPGRETTKVPQPSVVGARTTR